MGSSQKVVTSGDKKINVKPLPINNELKNFDGAVGSFNFTLNSSKTKLSVSEALELKLEINGQGNLKLFQLPELNLSSSLEVYEPEREEKISASIIGMVGSIRDLYTIVPSKPGRYKIPKISFTYFDIDSESYKIISSKELTIDVSGKEWSNESIKSDDLKINSISKTVTFLPFKTKTTLTKIRKILFFNSSFFWILFLAPFIITLLIIILINYFKVKGKYSNNDLLLQAKKLAKKHLSEAKSNLGRKEDFYESLDRALHNYLKSIIVLENSNYTKNNITIELEKRQVPKSITLSLNKLFKNCEMARYTPITNVEMKSDYTKAIEIISQIDKEIN